MDNSPPRSIDIAEVARRTGLTARALRFYEARGLVQPLRSASGRRHYGPAEMERLHQIVMLKRAGLSLAQIQRIAGRKAIDLPALVAAQIASLDAQAREIEEARKLLLSVQSRIDRSEPIDVATFCSLIRRGEMTMQKEQWDKVTDRYFSAEEKAEFGQRMDMVPDGFDASDYATKWKDLGSRIKAAMPMDPAGPQAQAFLAEWKALLKPFTDVATPAMLAGTTRMYERMDEWQGEADPGFDKAVFDLMREAGKAATGGGS